MLAEYNIFNILNFKLQELREVGYIRLQNTNQPAAYGKNEGWPTEVWQQTYSGIEFDQILK